MSERRVNEPADLPQASAAVADYLPYTVLGNTVIVSGQICRRDGKLEYAGKAGKDYTAEQAKEAARLCALNVLAQLKAACGGDLTKVARCVELNVFTNSTPEFTQHSVVADGASALMAEVFGERGRHARTSVGCPSLPVDTLVEVRGVFELAA